MSALRESFSASAALPIQAIGRITDEAYPMTQSTNRRIIIIDDNQAIHDDFEKILT